MTYDQFKVELKSIVHLNNEIQNRAYSFLDNIISITSDQLVTEAMKNLIINCFVIISVYDFNIRDFNTIKSELNKAGWISNKGNK